MIQWFEAKTIINVGEHHLIGTYIKINNNKRMTFWLVCNIIYVLMVSDKRSFYVPRTLCQQKNRMGKHI